MKNQTALFQFLDVLKDVTNMFWSVGAVLSLIFYVLSAKLFFYILEQSQTPIAAMVEPIFWLMYLLPTALLVAGYFFTVLTINSYHKNS